MLFTAVGLVAASIATYARYGSFDPCDWMAQDLSQHSNLPHLVAEAKIRGEFLIRGVTDPNFGQCTTAWWKYRAEEAPKDAKNGG